MTIKLLNSVTDAIFILLVALIISNINQYKLVVITIVILKLVSYFPHKTLWGRYHCNPQISEKELEA